MKKLSKNSIFILMTIIILLQCISPILTVADTIAAKNPLVNLTSAKLVSVDEQTATIDYT